MFVFINSYSWVGGIKEGGGVYSEYVNLYIPTQTHEEC